MSSRDPLLWLWYLRALLIAVWSENVHPSLVKYLHMIESSRLAPIIVTEANGSNIEGASKPCTSRVVGLAGFKLLESLMIHIEVPMIVPKAPDEIGEMHINLVILHLDQGFVQLAMILCFESAIPFMA